MSAVAEESGTLKGYKESRAEVRQEIEAKKREYQSALDKKLELLNAEEPDQAKIDVYSDIAETAKTELEALQEKEAEFSSTIEALEKLNPVIQLEPDEAPSDETDDDNEFSDTRPAKSAVSIESYSWRDSFNHEGTKTYGEGTKIRVPASGEKSDQAKEYDADVTAHPQYEVLFNDYMRYAGGQGHKADSFARFFKDHEENYSGIQGASIGIPLLPMRIINLLECKTNATVFMRDCATVINVTEACSLEIWKREGRVSSYHRGCVCKDVPKSGVPDAQNAKVLEPTQWSQAAEVCRRKLRCSAIDPVQLLLLDIEEERAECKEFEYIYGSGIEGPLGIWADTAVPEFTFDPSEFDAEGNFVDVLKSLKRIYKHMPQRIRANANNKWIMTDWMFCQILDQAKSGQGCCHEGLRVTETNGVLFLEGVGIPRRRILVIDEELRNLSMLDEDGKSLKQKLPDNHPARNIVLSFGDLSSYYIADFALGTTLETETDIRKDTICWVIRGFDDALFVCADRLMRWRIPTAEEMSAKSPQAKKKAEEAIRGVAISYAPRS